MKSRLRSADVIVGYGGSNHRVVPSRLGAAGVAVRLGGPVWFIDDDSALLVRDLAAEPEVVSSSAWLRFNGGGQLVSSH